MAEESGEPSDGMTRQSPGKPLRPRLLSLLPGFLLLLIGSWPWLSTVLPQWGKTLWQWVESLWQWCLGSRQWVSLLPMPLFGFLLLSMVAWPWLSTVLPQWGKTLWQKCKAAWRWCKEWMGRLPLFVAIAIWVVLAAGLLAVLVYWWGGWPTAGSESGADVSSMTKNGIGIITVNTDQGSGAFEAVKSALTAVAGIGGVAYLVIKYRTEQRETAGIADRKISAAVEQLGSDKASTRIAGVYALADVADTYRGGYRQRVVDILCGYLRSDRSSYAPDESGQPVWDASGHLVESGGSDEAVESTILAMFATHLRIRRQDGNGAGTVRKQVGDDQLWLDCDFDFHGAVFHGAASFDDFVFKGTVDFRGATFGDGASFFHATFEGVASFDGATFRGVVSFIDATFEGWVFFDGATFRGVVSFIDATFGVWASFDRATFRGWASFDGATFRGVASFHGARFNRKFKKDYEWGPIPLQDNGLPKGAEWFDPSV